MATKKRRKSSTRKKSSSTRSRAKKAYSRAGGNKMLTGVLVGGLIGYAAAKMMGGSNETPTA